MWNIFSRVKRIVKKKNVYRIKLTRNFIQPTIPVADTSRFESASAITMAERIPIKKTAHFLTGAKSMDKVGFQSIKTSINTAARDESCFAQTMGWNPSFCYRFRKCIVNTSLVF
jgi:hypothetical protein